MEQKKKHLTIEEKKERDKNLLIKGDYSPHIFKAHGMEKLEKAYTLAYVRRTETYTCDVMLGSGKCNCECRLCNFHQLKERIVAEIILGERRKPNTELRTNPRQKLILESCESGDHISMEECRAIRKKHIYEQHRNLIALKMQARACMKNIVANI